ncbi:xaa-Pro aminopeptidase 1-like isoform X2 [Tachypleus tridentatus]|uniref:xaa-Pro aminopeptidase 1-like isoform X2 n=1 Tax=Tachypleus tridentatus TaxID=6853 RepID=UPI003FD49EAE
MVPVTTRMLIWLFAALILLTQAVLEVSPVDAVEKTRIETEGKRSTGEVRESDRLACPENSNPPSIRTNTSDRLRSLREVMTLAGYDAYIIPSEDDHQSKYVSEYDKRRKYISGFTGSAGIAVVLQKENEGAALWTDGRYFLQADKELDCNWLLMKLGLSKTPKVSEWLSSKLSRGATVGVDARLITYTEWHRWEKELRKYNISLIGEPKNLVDNIWTVDQGRPLESRNPIFIHELKYAGKSWETKLADLQETLELKGVNGTIVTALDDIAWLFNVRGSDIPYNPFFKAYALILPEQSRLYVRKDIITPEVEEHLKLQDFDEEKRVHIAEYDTLDSDLPNVLGKSNKILISPKSSYYVHSIVPQDQKVVEESPIIMMKIVKNEVEIEGMKNAHLRDAVALIDFVSLLEEEVKAGIPWDEIKAQEELSKYRLEQPLNKGDSFSTISASGPNGAVIHYSSKPETNRSIDTEHIYLLDSGGQYLDGTTDVTRTFHFGTPTDFQKETYTRVLMGAIELASFVFREGTRDKDFELLARKYLYEAGLNYNHGTGHGIGAFLCVHEFPPLISSASSDINVVLKAGMFSSDEPGYYEEGEFGIRLENIIMVTEAKTKVNWLNDYHQKVRYLVGKELLAQDKGRAYAWMMNKTQHIPFYPCQRLVKNME